MNSGSNPDEISVGLLQEILKTTPMKPIKSSEYSLEVISLHSVFSSDSFRRSFQSLFKVLSKFSLSCSPEWLSKSSSLDFGKISFIEFHSSCQNFPNFSFREYTQKFCRDFSVFLRIYSKVPLGISSIVFFRSFLRDYSGIPSDVSSRVCFYKEFRMIEKAFQQFLLEFLTDFRRSTSRDVFCIIFRDLSWGSSQNASRSTFRDLC